MPAAYFIFYFLGSDHLFPHKDGEVGATACRSLSYQQISPAGFQPWVYDYEAGAGAPSPLFFGEKESLTFLR
jgi:hypothetical protein